MKRFKKKRCFFLFTLIALLVLANSCVTLRDSDKKMTKKFKKIGQKIKIFHTPFKGKSLRYVTSTTFDKSKPTVIFVHGAPGSLDNFYKHLQDLDLQKKANLIAVDRLGYGYSEFGKTEVSIAKQADALNFIANKYADTKIVLMSWSYGGPITGKMAIDNPIFSHLLMVAPAVSPKDEKHFWLGYLANWKATKWLVPKVFVVAEKEKLAHTKELEILETEWQNLKTPTTHYHGTKDWLVPYKNMAYFKTKINDSILKTVTIKGGKHIIFFKNYDLIKKELLEILNNL
jgi:pimeloyl-ACP methyl ester carboxylesterase